MSTKELRNTPLSGSSTPPLVAPHYGSTATPERSEPENARYARSATGGRFLSSLPGLLNIIIIVSKDFIFIE